VEAVIAPARLIDRSTRPGRRPGARSAPRARTVLALLSTSFLAFAATDAATAAPTVMPPALVTYRGIHPVSPHMGAFCYIKAVHVHRVAPADMRVYVVLPGQQNLFVGDPVALGYEGPRFGYFGPHPLVVPAAAPGGAPGTASGSPLMAPIYCYLKAAHYHADPPPAARPFVEQAGVFWYMGPATPDFERERFRTWINEAAPIAGYHAPVADLTAAPPGYHPLVLAGAQPHAPIAAAPRSLERRATKPTANPGRRARRPR
jgi:hypothetical protein